MSSAMFTGLATLNAKRPYTQGSGRHPVLLIVVEHFPDVVPSLGIGRNSVAILHHSLFSGIVGGKSKGQFVEL
jgi:hypothetical protein